VTHRFEVWAPIPERTDLVLEQGTVSMTPDGSGWWRADVDDAGPGTRLRAARRHVHPEGTFDAADRAARPPRRPGRRRRRAAPGRASSRGRGWGYDGVDLYAPHDAYGGPDGLKRLVDACHAGAGSAVVLDVVYNHLGPAGNYLPEFGPYFTDRTTRPGVRRQPRRSRQRRGAPVRLDNALMWLRDYHVDGLRLDAVHAIVDDSGRHLLEELADRGRRARRAGRPLVLIAESDLNDPRDRPRREVPAGYGLDAAVGRRLPPRAARRPHRRAHGYYEDFGSLAAPGQGAARGVPCTTAYWSPHRRRPMGAPAAWRATVRGLCSRTTTRSATAPSAIVGRARAGPGTAGRRRARADRAVRADAVPGRGVGGVDAVPVLHRSRRPGSRPRAVSEGRRGRCGPRRARQPRTDRAGRARRSGPVRRGNRPVCDPTVATGSACHRSHRRARPGSACHRSHRRARPGSAWRRARLSVSPSAATTHAVPTPMPRASTTPVIATNALLRGVMFMMGS
jgi:hypothetical protein